MTDPGRFRSRLGYHFDDPALLRQALTHRSRGGRNNERLEFLGDAILGFVVAEALFRQFPRASEGELTRMRARLVRRETLADIARQLEMGPHLNLGVGELRSGGADRDSILSDALEALIGAIYLDSGIEAATGVLLRLLEEQLGSVSPDIVKDPKTRLQELLQKQGLPLPLYEVVRQEGKPHELLFIVECRAGEPAAVFRGEGGSRRDAEQQAALQAIEALS